MNLRLMEIFCTVVESGKMAVAAENLGMSPPAVSRSIKELENSLNTQLIVRTTRSMSLTAEGKSYYQNAKTILSDVHDLNKMFIKDAKSIKGKLKVVAPTSFGVSQLGKVVSDFKELFPDIQLHIDFEDQISALHEKGYDLAIRVSEKLKDSTLKARQFSSFGHHLFVHKDLLDKHGTPTEIEDLRKFPCLAYSYHKTPNVWRMKKDQDNISFEFSPILTANNSLFILEQVKLGAGMALLPSFLLHLIQSDKDLIEVFPHFQKPIASAWVLFVRTGHRRLAERAFSDLLMKSFSV